MKHKLDDAHTKFMGPRQETPCTFVGPGKTIQRFSSKNFNIYVIYLAILHMKIIHKRHPLWRAGIREENH